MNILIIGNGKINEALKQEITRQGVNVSILPSLDDFVQLKDVTGSFCAVSGKENLTVDGVIITEAPYFEEVAFGEGKALGLMQANLLEELLAAEPEQTIVFLLDYLSETPEYLVAKALRDALCLARQDRKVVFLSRFVKTSSNGMEQTYREARQAGVTFVKYEQVSCAFQNGVFSIQAFDGVLTSNFTTSALVAVGKEAQTKEQIIKKFRLAKNNQGYVNGNKFFLSPMLTSRKGVYYFHPDLTERTGIESVRKVLPFIMAEFRELAREPKDYAKVDAKKCAFCYSCYRVCPHAALEPDLGPDTENNAMKCVESACMACGACAAICPGQAITLTNEEQAPEIASKPAPAVNDRCKVFCCENSAYWAMLSLAEDLDKAAVKLDVEKIPCGGRIGQDDITSALVGYDKVLMAVCMDDACKHMVGGKRACQNAEKLAATVEQMQLPGKKVVCVKASCAMKKVLAEEVRAFVQNA